jgi:hypothetical protein
MANRPLYLQSLALAPYEAGACQGQVVPPGGFRRRRRSLLFRWEAGRCPIGRWEGASPDLLLQRSGGRLGLCAVLLIESFPKLLI